MLSARVKGRSTLTNALLYVYRHELEWCWNGTKITDINHDYDDGQTYDPTYYWRGNLTHSKSWSNFGGTPKGKYTTKTKGEFEQCLGVPQWSCIATYQPWIKIVAYADGDQVTTGSAG